MQRSDPVAVAAAAALLAVFAALACGAQDWMPCGWGGGGFFWCAAFHPTRDGVLYMGGDVNGVYRSEDHGQHWRIVNNGLANYGVYSLAVDRAQPDTVYAATEGGLCKSVDAGAHWGLLSKTGPKELRITGERNKSIRSVAVDPTDSRIVYATSPLGRAFKSEDGGQNWRVIHEKTEEAESVDFVRFQFGKVDEQWHGGFWVPVTPPAAVELKDCEGIGFSFKGGGAIPQQAFLTLRMADGSSYRSRQLKELFGDANWRDVLLKASDFSLDADYAKNHPEAAKKLSAAPEWAAVRRFDFSSVRTAENGASVAKFGRFYFARPTRSQSVTFCDTAALRTASLYANVRRGAGSDGSIFSVSVAAKKPSRVALATETSGALLSDDAGTTWRPTTTPRKVAHVAFDEADPDHLLAACFTEGLWQSIDAGRTWNRLPIGTVAKFAVTESAIVPSGSRDLLAIGTDGWNGAILVSSDGGRSWTNRTRVIIDREGDPTSTQGDDKGTASLSTPSNLAINPRNPSEVFVSANWRSCLSRDGGQTWIARNRGADISCVHDIQFDKTVAYVAAMDEGAFTSSDDGGSWRPIAPVHYDASLVGHSWRIAVTPGERGTRLLATFSPWWNKYPNRIVRSENDGQTYEIVTAGLPDHVPTANTMWGQGAARALAVDPKNPDVVYLGIDGDPQDGKSGGGVFKSVDGGRSWRQLASQPGSRRVFHGLAVDPTDSRRIFWAACGSGGGVYRSEDAGVSWQSVFSNELWPFNLMVTADGTVYCPGRDLWRSTDHGATWKKVTNRPDDGGVIVALASDPRRPQRLWYGVMHWDNSSRGGVFASADAGANWHEITGNLPHRKPLVLRFNPATEELWAGGVGLYRCKP